jgi:hypothetical protein
MNDEDDDGGRSFLAVVASWLHRASLLLLNSNESTKQFRLILHRSKIYIL